MFTASFFSSKYKGGDNIWRDTRYNRNFALNFLLGKEWQVGHNNKQNILSLNIRLSYQGGDHYSPINETNAFSKQFSPAFTTHFTASYKINKRRTAHEIALKIINATMYQEFSGFQYNYLNHRIDERREAIYIPNLSYKIEF